MIDVLNPGFFTLIQDAGRFGFQEYGMPVSGALDLDSYRMANWLVGNGLNESVLETTMTGPVLKFHKKTSIGITGANMQPMIDGMSVDMNKTLQVNLGSVLSFGKLKSGFRSYISFAGGINVPLEMGSSSTYTYAKIGGIKGESLAKGDKLFLKDNPISKYAEIPLEYQSKYYELLSVRFIEGPEFYLLGKKEQEKMCANEFVIGSQSNRMGYRLENVGINSPESFEMLSSGIVKGTIQLPPNGDAILLLSDAQTTGGYPRIGNVIQADLSLLGQQKPGDKIRFRKVELEEANSIAYNKEKFLGKLFND